ncbi:MAG: D-ribose pyranase [Oscillospiraceae bacterium]
MKKSGLLNPQILSAIAEIGHTDYLVIADPGLPLPEGVKVIDISLVRGMPAFTDVLQAVTEEFVIESYTIAVEMPEASQGLYKQTEALLPGLPQKRVTHSDFKELTKKARAIIRTGETTAYANVILTAGVNF